MKTDREKELEQLIERIKMHQDLLNTKADLREFLESNEIVSVDSKVLIMNFIAVLTEVIGKLQKEVLINGAWEDFDDFF